MVQPDYTTTNRAVYTIHTVVLKMGEWGFGLAYLARPFDWLMSLIEFVEKTATSAKEMLRQYQPYEKE